MLERLVRVGQDSGLPKSGYVSPAWVKSHYGISNSTLYKWIAEEVLPPPLRFGTRATRFSVADLQRFETTLRPTTDVSGQGA